MKHVRSAKSSLKAGQPEQEPSGLANPPELSQVRQMYSRGRMTPELTPGGIRGKV
jgi:hypothetical protein